MGRKDKKILVLGTHKPKEIITERKKEFGTAKSEISISVSSKEALVTFLKTQLDKNEKFKYVLSTTRQDCGCTHSFKTFNDIPEKSLTCEHGNRIILYTGEK